MIKRTFVLLALCCGMCLPARAAGMALEGFQPENLESPITGICITMLPQSGVGTVLLGDRPLRPGDVLTAEQAAMLTFSPADPEKDASIQVGYLPILENAVAPEAVLTFAFRGRENQPPVAEDFAMETYKNLEITGDLKAKDPEGEAMTYCVTRQPRRGTVELGEDGSFTYVPKKNKVGIDSFVFTATDAAGKVSREATVTISILKPTDAAQYTDTAGQECRFYAEWLRHTGIFAGETVGGNPCFAPEKPVTQGEFLTMLVKELDLPTAKELEASGFGNMPGWLKPYLTAALRSGLIAGVQESFQPDTPMDGETAAVMLCNALGLVPEDAEVLAPEDTASPALTMVNDLGIPIPQGTLTRADTARILYTLSTLLAENVKIRAWQ